MFAPSKARILARIAKLAIFAVLLGSLAPLDAQSDESSSRHSLEGAWWVTVTLYNCSTGVKGPPFSSMLLFSRGGTLTETTSNPGFLPGQRSIGIGTWETSLAEDFDALIRCADTALYRAKEQGRNRVCA